MMVRSKKYPGKKIKQNSKDDFNKNDIINLPARRSYLLIAFIFLFSLILLGYHAYINTSVSKPYSPLLKSIEITLVILYLLIFTIILVMIYRFERRKTKDIHELKKIRDDLEEEIKIRKHIDEALQENEVRYRAIFENIDNAVAVYEVVGNGEDFIFKDFNRVGERIDNVRREDIVGKPVTQIFPGVRKFGLFDVFKRVWETGKPEEFPLSFYKDERLSGWRDNYIYRLPNGEIVAVYSDETERMKAQEERELLITELERKNYEMEQFTYTVSHDLKSPLITIKGFVGLLEKDIAKNIDTNIETYLKRIYNAAEKMQVLLDELLELSRIGRIVKTPEKLSFENLAKEAVESVAGHLEEMNPRIEIAKDLPNVFVDGSRIRQILSNLIDNALKFTDKDNSHILVGMRRDNDENVFFVRDNGIGIDPEYHEKIFGLFNKLDSKTEGTGAGLAIAKRIIEVHGGRIWVESEGPGKGSTFCFTLPSGD